MAEGADYIVVGAGSAGCVVATRLAEAGAEVVLLEAGPADRHPMIHIPAGIRSLLENPAVNWNYKSEPEAGTDQRAIAWPRGRVLGGSSSINGMLYVRGNPQDYNTWSQMGCRGWSWDEVLPLFKKSERFDSGEDEFRGRDGVLRVENYRTILPATHKFVEAATQAGFEKSPDLNGRQPEGVGYSQMTRRGRLRASTARTFLLSARNRSNLTIRSNCVATGLTFEGERCVGVRFNENGVPRELRASGEVIVSGGAVNSPHLLQISGIGPAAHLEGIGVDVRHELPGVGGNLQDHYVIRVVHRLRDGVQTINQLARPPRVLYEAMRWLVKGDGALTFGVTSAQVFCRSREGLASPDLQLLFTPASYDQSRFGVFEKKPGASVAVCPVRPQSRGTIMAESADPLARPVIRPGYLSADDDYRVLLAGIAHARSIFAAPAFQAISEGELYPGPERTSDETLREFARTHGATIYHPVGTCKMGEDPQAVVDSRLRVHGLQGVRVIDASVMPVLTTGNTNAPTIMIGEKGAQMILEDAA
ncbi:MAG: GMC family oxidoreductase N-terminal domain-containing protein [Pseudomonadota bacterium]